jgi:DNA processing protein
VAQVLGRAVASAGWPVISGLARGIDGAAHQGCVDSGEPGWAVLGSGVDIVYPRQNESLARKLVAEGGGLISEYEPGTPPAPFRFPARNRIIAALSKAVVVVEAAVTGGALITARLALELGREVFAIPGDIDRRVSEGCNLLIRDGAHPALGPDDLIELLTFVMGPPPRAPAPRWTERIDQALATSDRPVGEALAELTRRELGI